MPDLASIGLKIESQEAEVADRRLAALEKTAKALEAQIDKVVKMFGGADRAMVATGASASALADQSMARVVDELKAAEAGATGFTDSLAGISAEANQVGASLGVAGEGVAGLGDTLSTTEDDTAKLDQAVTQLEFAFDESIDSGKAWKEVLAQAAAISKGTEKDVKGLGDQVLATDKAWDDSTKRMRDGLGRLVTGTKEAVDGSRQAEKAIKDVGDGASGTGDKLKKAAGDFGFFGTAGREVSFQLRQVLQALLVGVSVREVVGEVNQFQQAYSRLEGTLRLGGKTLEDQREALKRFKEEARNISLSDDVSGGGALQAFSEFSKLGFETEESINAGKAAISLSEASTLSLAEALQFLVRITKQFNLEGEQLAPVVDSIITVSNRAGVEINFLADSLATAGPTAKALGVDFKELAASLGILSEFRGRTGVTGLNFRTFLGTLTDIDTKKDAGKDLEEKLKGVGLAVSDLNPKANSLIQILERLKKAQIDLSDANKIFGDAQGAGVLVLLDNIETIKQLTAEQQKNLGVAKELEAVYDDNLPGALRELKASVNQVASDQSELTDGLREGVYIITDVVRALGGMEAPLGRSSDGTKALVSAIRLVTDNAGKLASVFAVGLLVQLYSWISATYKAAEAGKGLVAVLLKINAVILAHPILAVVAALGLLAGAFFLMRDRAIEAADALEQLQKTGLDFSKIEAATASFQGLAAAIEEAARAGDFARQLTSLQQLQDRVKQFQEETAGQAQVPLKLKGEEARLELKRRQQEAEETGTPLEESFLKRLPKKIEVDTEISFPRLDIDQIIPLSEARDSLDAILANFKDESEREAIKLRFEAEVVGGTQDDVIEEVTRRVEGLDGALTKVKTGVAEAIQDSEALGDGKLFSGEKTLVRPEKFVKDRVIPRVLAEGAGNAGAFDDFAAKIVAEDSPRTKLPTGAEGLLGLVQENAETERKAKLKSVVTDFVKTESELAGVSAKRVTTFLDQVNLSLEKQAEGIKKTAADAGKPLTKEPVGETRVSATSEDDVAAIEKFIRTKREEVKVLTVTQGLQGEEAERAKEAASALQLLNDAGIVNTESVQAFGNETKELLTLLDKASDTTLAPEVRDGAVKELQAGLEGLLGTIFDLKKAREGLGDVVPESAFRNLELFVKTRVRDAEAVVDDRTKTEEFVKTLDKQQKAIEKKIGFSAKDAETSRLVVASEDAVVKASGESEEVRSQLLATVKQETAAALQAIAQEDELTRARGDSVGATRQALSLRLQEIQAVAEGSSSIEAFAAALAQERGAREQGLGLTNESVDALRVLIDLQGILNRSLKAEGAERTSLIGRIRAQLGAVTGIFSRTEDREKRDQKTTASKDVLASNIEAIRKENRELGQQREIIAGVTEERRTEIELSQRTTDDRDVTLRTKSYKELVSILKELIGVNIEERVETERARSDSQDIDSRLTSLVAEGDAIADNTALIEAQDRTARKAIQVEINGRESVTKRLNLENLSLEEKQKLIKELIELNEDLNAEEAGRQILKDLKDEQDLIGKSRLEREVSNRTRGRENQLSDEQKDKIRENVKALQDLQDFDLAARSIARSFTDAFSQIALEGADLEDALKGVAKRISESLLEIFVFRPFEDFFAGIAADALKGAKGDDSLAGTGSDGGNGALEGALGGLGGDALKGADGADVASLFGGADASLAAAGASLTGAAAALSAAAAALAAAAAAGAASGAADLFGGLANPAGGGLPVYKALGDVFPFKSGAAFGDEPGMAETMPPEIRAFAKGNPFLNSIVSKPTKAPLALFGEAGPEAIVPLKSGKGGLGVSAYVGGKEVSLAPLRRGVDRRLGIDLGALLQALPREVREERTSNVSVSKFASGASFEKTATDSSATIESKVERTFASGAYFDRTSSSFEKAVPFASGASFDRTASFERTTEKAVPFASGASFERSLERLVPISTFATGDSFEPTTSSSAAAQVPVILQQPSTTTNETSTQETTVTVPITNHFHITGAMDRSSAKKTARHMEADLRDRARRVFPHKK